MRYVVRAGAIAFALAVLGFAMCTAQRNARDNSTLPATKAGPIVAPDESQAAPQQAKKPARPDPYVFPASKAGPVFVPPPQPASQQQAGPQ
jgi:hypothetical protein